MIKYKIYTCTTGTSFILYKFHKHLGYYNIKSCCFFFLSLPREPVSNTTLDYKDSMNPWGVEVEIVVQHDIEATCTKF
jgi:hypothetical protein